MITVPTHDKMPLRELPRVQDSWDLEEELFRQYALREYFTHEDCMHFRAMCHAAALLITRIRISSLQLLPNGKRRLARIERGVHRALLNFTEELLDDR
jgi:hypothetical protein